MTETIDTLRQKELKVERELEQVEDETRALTQVSEEYEEFFYYNDRLFLELEEQFHQNSFHSSLIDHADGLRQHQFQLLDTLEEEKEQLNKKKYSLENKQNDLFHQRRALLLEREEQTNEY